MRNALPYLHATAQPQRIPTYDHYLKIDLSLQFPRRHCAMQLKLNSWVSSFWFMYCRFNRRPDADLRFTPGIL